MNSIFGGIGHFSSLVIQRMKKNANPVYAASGSLYRLLLKLLIGFIGVLEDQTAACSSFLTDLSSGPQS